MRNLVEVDVVEVRHTRVESLIGLVDDIHMKLDRQQVVYSDGSCGSAELRGQQSHLSNAVFTPLWNFRCFVIFLAPGRGRHLVFQLSDWKNSLGN
jgi:hypothetical protein